MIEIHNFSKKVLKEQRQEFEVLVLVVVSGRGQKCVGQAKSESNE
jgi:hypothetical protein